MTRAQTTSLCIAAPAWVGTPFHPHQAVRGVGADCVQFALALYQDAGVLPKGVVFPEYRLDTGDSAGVSIVTDWLGDPANGFVQTFKEDAGRLAVFRLGRVAHHVGVLLGPHSFIHAIRKYGVMISDLRDTTWKSRLHSLWEPR